MRKLFSLLFALVLMVSCRTASATYGEPYYRFLNGDPNYILVAAHMEVAYYVDRRTVKKLPPFEYVEGKLLSIETSVVRNALPEENKGMEIAYKYTSTFFYHDSTLIMMQEQKKDDGTIDWYAFKPYGCWAETGAAMRIGEMAYYLAYHRRFFGSPSYQAHYPGTPCPFGDSFYEGI